MLPSSQVLNQLATSWSPWEQSPLFLQQRHSLSSIQVPSYLLRSINSISNVKTTSQPTHHPLATKARNENENSSPSERSPTSRKLKIHNSVKSLVNRPSREGNLMEDYKFLSNSLNCLDVAKL